MRPFTFSLFLFCLISVANAQICRQHFDFSKQPLDTDGIPICPVVNSPSTYMGCAFEQAKNFVKVTPDMKSNMRGLLQSLKDGNVVQTLPFSNKLNLQVCHNMQDQYYVFVTKPQVNDYSGPFLLWRPTNSSNLVIQNPHNQDCTPISYGTTLFLNTHAFLYMGNGYSRSLSGKKVNTCWGASYLSDPAHNSNNLFYATHVLVSQIWPQSVFFHNHGTAAKGFLVTNNIARDCGPSSLLYAFGQSVMAINQQTKRFDLSVLKACAPGTPLTTTNCKITSTFIEGRQITNSSEPNCAPGKVNTNRWLAIEQSSAQIINSPQFMTSVLLDLEKRYPGMGFALK